MSEEDNSELNILRARLLSRTNDFNLSMAQIFVIIHAQEKKLNSYRRLLVVNMGLLFFFASALMVAVYLNYKLITELHMFPINVLELPL